MEMKIHNEFAMFGINVGRGGGKHQGTEVLFSVVCEQLICCGWYQ